MLRLRCQVSNLSVMANSFLLDRFIQLSLLLLKTPRRETLGCDVAVSIIPIEVVVHIAVDDETSKVLDHHRINRLRLFARLPTRAWSS